MTAARRRAPLRLLAPLLAPLPVIRTAVPAALLRQVPLRLLAVTAALLVLILAVPWVAHAQTPPNQAPTGLPIVLATAEGGPLLYADTLGIADGNGIPWKDREGGTDDGADIYFQYSYQWVRVDGTVETNIGGDSPWYELVDADTGKLIKVDVWYTDLNGYAESLTSVPLGPIVRPSPLPSPTTLVGNTGQTPSAAAAITRQYAVEFTSGTHGQGYELSSVSIDLAAAPTSLTVSLWMGGHSSRSSVPQARLFDFENPASFAAGLNQFTAPAGLVLYPSFRYWIVLSDFGSTLSINETTSDAEDPGGEPGAELRDNAREISVIAATETGPWRDSSDRGGGGVLRLAVEGSKRSSGIVTSSFAQPTDDPPDQEIISLGDDCCFQMGVGDADRYLIRGFSVYSDDTSIRGGITNPIYLRDGTKTTGDNQSARLFRVTNTRNTPGGTEWTAPQGATVAGGSSKRYTFWLDFDHLKHIGDTARLGAILMRIFATTSQVYDQPAAAGVTLSDHGDVVLPGSPLMAVIGEPLDAVVQNLGQADNSFVSLGAADKVVSQGFTTGPSEEGYQLQGFGVNIEGSASNFPEDSASVAVALHADSGGKPGAKLFDLVSPTDYGAGHSFFEAPRGTVLEGSASYVLVWRHVSGTLHRLQKTSSNGEDPGAVAGFSIADAYYVGADLANLAEDPDGNSVEIAVYARVGSAPATGRPVVYPSAEGAGILFADTAGIEDPNGLPLLVISRVIKVLNYSYQWIRVDADTGAETLVGVDSNRYQRVDADTGHRIKVRVEFTDGGGNPEEVTSLPFGPMAEPAGPSRAPTTLVSNAGQPAQALTAFDLHTDNFAPRGLWSDGTTIWVANDGSGAGNKLFAYKRSDNSRDSGKDFAADTGAGNLDLRGICSDGATMFVADDAPSLRKFFAYKVSDQSRDSGKDFNLHADNAEPTGVWCNASTIWVADSDDHKIYAYKLSDGSRDSGRDFDTLDAAGNDHPRGIWSDGTTMWVADSDDDKVYAYKMSDESRDADKDITLDSGNDAPYGVWSDGTVLLVADTTDTELYAYDLPGAPPVGSTRITQQYAQGFRLGAHGQGYEITGVSFELAEVPSSLSVSLWNGGREGMPNTGVANFKLFDFENPSSFRVGENEFTAPAGAFAYQNVNYFIVLSGFGDSLTIKETRSDAEDAGGETGAVIFNSARTRGLGSTGSWYLGSTSRGNVLRMAVTGSQRDRGILVANYAQAAKDAMGNENQEIVSAGDVITVEIDVGAADRYLIRGVSFHADGTIPGPTVPPEEGVSSTGGPIGNPMYLWDTTSRDEDDLTTDAGLFSLTNTRSHVGINVWTAPQGSTAAGANASYFVGQLPTDPRLYSVLGRYFPTEAPGQDTPAADGAAIASDAIVGDGAWGDGRPLMAVLGEPLDAMAQNLGQADNGYVELGGANAKALSQGFTTGSDGFGYRLQGIGVNIEGSGGNLPDDSTSVSVAVHADSNGQPGEKLFDLLSPAEYADGHSFFEAPPGTYLDPSASYVLVWTYNHGAPHRLQRTLSDGEDAGARTGAGIADVFYLGADPDSLAVDSGGNALEIAVYTEVLDTVRFREGEFVTPTRALVSNIGQETVSGSSASLLTNRQQAQRFTTGSSEPAYRLDSVDVKVASASAGVEAFVTAAIYTDASGEPGTKVYDLITPAKLTAGDHTFAAPEGATLASATTYFVIFFKSSSAIALNISLSNDEDAGGAEGWSIDNDRAISAVTGMTTTWSTSSSVLQIRVNGGTTAPPTEVEPGWPLVPDEVATDGGEFRLLFLTSGESAATSTDIDTYNAFVQAAAAAGHDDIRDYSEGFRAVASTTGVAARDNTGTTGASVPIYWLGGNRAADSYRDFYDGSWDDEENPTDETGGAASATGAWTGSESDGTRGVHDTHGATVLGGGAQAQAAFGTLDSATRGPLSGGHGWREIERSLYAVSEVFTVGPNPAVITDLAITSDPGPDGMYRTGDEIEVTATFGAPVTVVGQPRVKLRLGRTEDSDRWAEAEGDAAAAVDVVDLVSNTGQSKDDAVGVETNTTKAAQAFTTGSAAHRYALSSIAFVFSVVDASTAGAYVTATLNEEDNGEPGDALCTLDAPARFHDRVARLTSFDVPAACPTLQPDTTYFAVIEHGTEDASVSALVFAVTQSSNEDSGGAAGWVIGNQAHVYTSDDMRWDSFNNESYKMEVRGSAAPTPLVRNTGQSSGAAGGLDSSTTKRAQSFTTGAHAGGYRLDSIGIGFASTDNTATAGEHLTVTLNSDNSGSPGGTLCTLRDPETFKSSLVLASVLNTFKAPPACPALEASTTYFVVVDRVVIVAADGIALNSTTSDGEDAGGAAGWLVGNSGHAFVGANQRWDSVSYSLQIEVSAAKLVLAVPFTYTVQADDESDTDGIAVGVAGEENAVDLNEGAITLAGSSRGAVLGFSPVPSDAGHLVNWARPTLVDAATSTDGRRLFLTFDEELNPDGSPPTSSFAVTVDGGAVALSGTTASVGGRVVALRLATPLDSAAQRLSVGYTDPSDGDDVAAVEDRQGNDAASFVDRTVTNRFEALNRVFPDHVLIPAGLGVGDSFRLLFLTSTTRDATATDIEVYNTFVRAAAAAGHADIRDYSGRFYAVASTADDDARDNTGTTYTSSNPGVPIHWLGGNQVADDYGDFYDGTWDAEYTATDESGEAYDDGGMGVGVWTGTDDDGTEYHDPPGIGAGPRGLGTATNRGPQLGQINTSNDTDMDATKPNPLNSGGVNPASNLFPLYGLSEVFTVIDPASITDVAIVSDPGSDGNYETGDEVEVAVTFGGAVEIEGNPRIRLRLGGSEDSVRWAQYRREALVRNTGQPQFSGTALTAARPRLAQGFRTGGRAHELGAVGIKFHTISNPATAAADLKVTLHADEGGNPAAAPLCTLSDPAEFGATGLQTFAAPEAIDAPDACPDLAENTDYYVVVERVSFSAAETIAVWHTASPREDAGGALGWSIGDGGHTDTGPTGAPSWSDGGAAFLIRVSGQLTAVDPVDPVDPVDLVKNTGQSLDSLDSLTTAGNKAGQAFTTGANEQGYVLNSLSLDIYSWTDASLLTVTLNAEDNGAPGDALCTLSTPASLANVQKTFDAPSACPTLTPSTTYFVVVERLVAGADELAIAYTASDAEDSGSAPDWSIAGFSVFFDGISWGTFAGDIYYLEVRAKAVVSDPSGPAPQPRRFIYTVAAGDESTARGVAVGGAGATDDLDLNGGAITVVATGAEAPLDFTPLPPDGDHLVNWARPTLVRAGTSRDGSLVRLTFSEELETGGQVLNARFTVEVDGVEVELTGLPKVVPGQTSDGGEPLKAAIAGRVVTLEPVTPLTSAEQVVTVSYADPNPNDNDNVVEDLVGNDADSFTGRPVTNQFAFAPPPVEVPAGWALAPEGLPAGAEFRLLFLSSSTRDGTSALIEDYDDFVRAAAGGGHEAIREYAGGFFAVASTPDTDARDNTGTTYTASNRGVPIYWLGGNKAADNYADFYDGTWDDEANPTDQSGDHRILSEPADYPWTGSDHDGTEAGGGGGETPATRQPQPQPQQPVSEPDPPPASPLQVEIAVDWSLKPAGLEAGDRFRLLFLSSAKRDAASTDIGVYNTFVQDLAAAGHSDIQAYASQFRVVACTAAVDAVNNTGTDGTGVPIYWLGGARAADDYTDFYDGSWDEEVTVRNQAGGSVSIRVTSEEGKVWSGCEEDGSQGATSTNVSLALGTSAPGYGQLRNIGIDFGPINARDLSDASSDLRSLYALSPVFVVRPPTRVVPADWALKPAGLEAGDRFRLLFLSSAKRDAASTDIGVYNTFVQDLAAAGHSDIQAYASQFRVVACTAAVDAVNNTGTDGTGVPIYWLGGARAADDYTDFYDGSWDEEVTVRNQAGGSVSIRVTSEEGKVWSGCEEDGSQGATSTNVSLALGTSAPGYGQLRNIGIDFGPINARDLSDASSDLRSLYGLSPIYKVAEPIVVAGPSDAGPSDADSSDGTLRGLGGESGEAAFGAPGVAGAGPLNGGSAPLTDLRPLYALSQVFVVEPLVVPAGSPIVPGGLTGGDRFRLLFLTSGARDATSSAIADYNHFIQAAAAGGHSGVRAFSDGFRAVASTAAVDARGNTWTNTAGVPIYWLGGGRLAEDYAHFYDGGWDAEAGATDEWGGARAVTGDADRAWTGSDHDGTEAFNGSIPVGLGGGGSDFAAVGQLDSPVPGHGPLRGGLVAPTTAGQPLYGLSPVLVVFGPKDAPPDDPTDPPIEVPGVPPAGPSDAPTGLVAEAGNESVTLSWDPSDASDVSVTYYQYEQDGVWNTKQIPGTTFKVDVGGLNNRQTYRFRVRAVTGAGTGDPSPLRSATPEPQPPDPPKELKAVYGDGWVKLTWIKPDSDGGRPVTHYEYQYQQKENGKPGKWETAESRETVGSRDMTFTMEFLANGQSYRFRVQAANAVGPSRPSSFALAVAGNGVDPPPVVDPEAPVTVTFGQASYRVAEGGRVEVAVKLSQAPGRTVEIPITATPVDGADADDYSGVPASVIFQGGETDQSFIFRAAGDSVDDPGESVLLGFGTLPAGVTAGAITEATVSITDVGEAPDSTTGDATGLPQYFLAYWPTQTSITLGWFTVETAAEYKLEYRQDGETDWSRITGDFDHLPSTSDYRNAIGVAAGLECNTEYHFRLSFKGSGEARADGSRYPSDSFSGDAATSERTGECAQEERVTNLLVSIERDCATLTWTPPSGSRDTGYRVERRTYTNNRSQVSEPVTLVEEANPVAPRYQDCSAGYLSHGVGAAEHVYTVTALDSDPGPGEEGAFGSASTSLLVYGPSEEPEGPLNVRITQDSRSSRELAWDAPRERWLTTVKTARAGAGPQQVVLDPWVTGYRVERQEYRRTGDGYWDVVLPGEWETLREETDGDIRTSFTDATDQGDRQYVYRVLAHSARGLNLHPFRGDWAFTASGPGR